MGTQPNGEPITATHIDTYSHVGTHIESARHIYASGATLDSFPLDRFIGAGRVVDLTHVGPAPVSPEHLAQALPDLEPDAFVLLRLGNPIDATGEDGPHAYLSEEAARWLAERGARAVGVDTSTPDMHVSQRPHPLDIPAHRVLFGAGMLILENLGGQLEAACGGRFTVHAVPLPIPESDSSPVRVLLAPAS
jgi:arylformamidase